MLNFGGVSIKISSGNIYGDFQNIAKVQKDHVVDQVINPARIRRFLAVKNVAVKKSYHVLPERRCIWMFLKIGVPQNGWFVMENLIKMDDLGYHYFWKSCHLISEIHFP